MSTCHDVAIVGAGPIGIATAIHCRRLGLSVLVVDKGCLVSAMHQFPDRMIFFSTAELIAIAGIPFPCTRPKPSRDEALQYYRLALATVDVDLRLYETVTTIDDAPDGFALSTDKGVHLARRVVLATGFFDTHVPLGVAGEDLAKVSHLFTDGHRYSRQRLAIIGGANSAAIAALECWRDGAEVTLIHRGPGLRDSVKYWLRPDLENRIAEGAITAHYSTTVSAIHPDHLDLNTPDGPITIGNDFVLALTGYRADTSFLRRCGITLGKRDEPLINPNTFAASSRPGIHLCGCVLGGQDTGRIFIENARHDAEVLARHLHSALR